MWISQFMGTFIAFNDFIQKEERLNFKCPFQELSKKGNGDKPKENRK